jgi:hypothetical protein
MTKSRMNAAVLLVALVLLSGIAFAQGMLSGLNSLCATIKSIVPVVALLMFIMAGGIYAIGQIMGAETRARASVWATAMLVGGIIGLVIAASAGFLLSMFAQASLGSGGTVTIDTTTASC